MHKLFFMAALLTCTAPLTTVNADVTSDNAALRAEVARLKLQLQQLQSSCPAAAAPSPAAPAVVAAPVPAAAPAPPVAAPPVLPAAPPGYKLVKIEPPVVHDYRWKESKAWEQLQTDMTPAQVEALLGPDHATTSKGPRTLWGYGLLAGEPIGRVYFVDGKLALWRAPDQ